jgi:dipeptidase
MRKSRSFFLFILLFVAGLLLFSGHLIKSARASENPYATISGLKVHCTSVIVGKSASADGSVLLGHNEDWGNYLKPLCWNAGERHKPGEFFRLKDGQTIPEVEETFAFIWPAAECNGINERQVAIVDDTGSCRKEFHQTGRGIDLEEFVTLALQRSRSAREAVQTMGGLIEKYGYRSYNGEDGDIFSIADPSEGWWMEVTIGGLWVAQRVPDDQFVVLANRFRIGQVDLKDNTRFLGSSNLIDYAVKRGWYNPAGKPFDFNEVYGTPEVGRAPYNTRREWRGNCLLAGTRFKEEANPLTVVPQKKLTSRDLMALFRDHYEGTEYDLSQKYEKGSPHHTSGRTICVMSTDASSVAELRSWLPHEIGGVLWLSAGTPCSSVYVPYYLGVLEFPKPYSFITADFDRENAFWSFNSLENLVDRYYGEKKKIGEVEVRAIDYVAGIWKNFEDEEFGMRGSVETTALDLYKKDKALARSFLSSYSNALGLKAYNLAVMLGDQLRTSYYR